METPDTEWLAEEEPTKPSLGGCWAKIARAREHNYRLEQLAEAFLKRRPNQLAFDDHTEPGWVILRAVVEPVPDEFAAVAGDAIQNLRSALDLLVWQVVLTERGDPGRHTAFPICSTHDEFERRTKRPAQGRKSPLDGIDPTGEKWAIIERAQPYKPGHKSTFGLLSSFSNRDKHEGLLTPVSFVHAIDPEALVEFIGDVRSEIQLTFEAPSELKNNAEILRMRNATGLTVDVKGDPPFAITIADGETAISTHGLDRVRSDVVRVVRAFEPFF